MPLYTFDYEKPDGRKLRFFSHRPFPDPSTPVSHPSHPGILRDLGTWSGPEMRRDHLTGELISMSAARMNRPHLPAADHCPLCPPQGAASAPGSEIPLFASSVDAHAPLFQYDYVTFENLFPALWFGNESGVCEVILFSKSHDTHFSRMSFEQVRGIVEVWQDRSRQLGALPYVENVYIFENRGAEIGVTLHHPHGQIYAFNHTPARLLAQFQHADLYHSQNMSCLICDVAKLHTERKDLLLYEGDGLLAFMPEAPRFPYEIHITTKAHRTHIESLSESEVSELARLLPALVTMYDKLFGFELPYIMQHHQCPSSAQHHPSYHWNIQITPFHRSAQKLKYLAGAETGVGFFINDSRPEDKIGELKAVFGLLEPQSPSFAGQSPKNEDESE